MAEQIKALSEIDKVRKRINIWYGDNGYQAVTHTAKETVGNCVDEINKGNGDTINIVLHEDSKTLTITDNCKGLPVEGTDQQTGIENYKLLTEHLFASTKYDNGIENNDYTIGCNGVHLTVLTRASEYIEYEIARPNGNVYSFTYYKGELQKPLKVIKTNNDTTYTKITYKLDNEVFTTTTFNIKDILEIAEQQASLINGIIIVEDKNANEKYEYKFKNGVCGLLESKIFDKENLIDIIQINKETSFEIVNKGTNEKKTDDIKIDLYLTYTKEDDNNVQIEFLNGSNLIHHGTIQDGLIMGLRNSFNRFAKQEGLYGKNEKQLSKDDLFIGLNYIINFKSYFPIFANQTKFASYVDYYKDITQKIIEEYFEIYAIENKQDMIKLTNSILVSKRANEKAENTRKQAKKELEEKVNNASNRPSKFVPCRSKNPKEIDFIVIEGDSSLNSVKLSRDASCVCILPLKGKPINPFKCKIDDLLKNQEVLSMFKIMGCGVTYKGKSIKGMPRFNIDNMQVDKLLIATDFDNDGFHIQSLLLGIFYVLAPELLEKGKIFILYTPLYVIRLKQKIEYKNEETNELLAYSETERNSIVKMLNENKISFKETRFKGLGGLPVSIMSKALNKETRILKQVTMNDIEESKKWLELFLTDEKLKQRKEFIETKGHEYFDYSLFE